MPAEGLRPPTPLPAPLAAQRIRPRTVRRVVVGVGLVMAGAVIAAVFVATNGFDGPAQPLLPASTTSSAAPLKATFTTRTVPIAPTGATVTYPEAEVSGGAPGVAERIDGTLGATVAERVERFTRDAAEVGTGAPRTIFDVISATDAGRWGRYWSVRVDESSNLAGAHPTNTSLALTFDTTTGQLVPAREFVADQAAADLRIREALLRTADATLSGEATADDLTSLTLTPGPDGTTAPLSCSPTENGLTCVLDQGSLLGYALGPVEATVPWSQLGTKATATSSEAPSGQSS